MYFDGKYGASGTIYLKANQVKTTELDTVASLGSTSALNKMRQMNPDWTINDGTANEANENGLLWLCDESNWSDYKDIEKADYVMGAPSIEMYMDSYNQFHIKKGTSGYQMLKCKWFSANSLYATSGYSYAVGENNNNYMYNTETNSLKVDEYNLYSKSGEYWWLASISGTDYDYTVCGLNGDYLRLGYPNYYHDYFGICPVAILKSGIIPELAN